MRLLYSFALFKVLLLQRIETRDEYKDISTPNKYRYNGIWQSPTHNLDTFGNSEVDSRAKTTEESSALVTRERSHTKTMSALDMSFGCPETLGDAGNSRADVEVRSKMTLGDLRNVGNEWSLAVPQEDKNTVKQRISPKAINPTEDTLKSKSLKQGFQIPDLLDFHVLRRNVESPGSKGSKSPKPAGLEFDHQESRSAKENDQRPESSKQALERSRFPKQESPKTQVTRQAMELVARITYLAHREHRKEFEIQKQRYLDEKSKRPAGENMLKRGTERKKAWDSMNKSLAGSIKAARTNARISELVKDTAKVQKPLPYGGVAGHVLQLVAEQQRKVYFKENDQLWKMQFVAADDWSRHEATKWRKTMRKHAAKAKAARQTNYKIWKTMSSNVPSMAESAEQREMEHRKHLLDLVNRRYALRDDSHVPPTRDLDIFRWEITDGKRTPPIRWPKPDSPPGSQHKAAVAPATNSPSQASGTLQHPFNIPGLRIYNQSGLQRLHPAQDPSGLQYRIGRGGINIEYVPNSHSAFHTKHPSGHQHRFNPPKSLIPSQLPLKRNQPFNRPPPMRLGHPAGSQLPPRPNLPFDPPPPTRPKHPSSDGLRWEPQRPINREPLMELENPSGPQPSLGPDLPSEFRPPRRLRLKISTKSQHSSESQEHGQEDEPDTKKQRTH